MEGGAVFLIRLPRWPCKFSATQQMNMKMRDGFAAVCSVVYDGSIAIDKFFASGDLRNREKQVAE